jgi:putative transcriptional regulator
MYIRFRLRQCMDLYERRTGRRITYPELAERSGISEDTIESIGSRRNYNTTTDTLQAICRALGVRPCDLIGWESEP